MVTDCKLLPILCRVCPPARIRSQLLPLTDKAEDQVKHKSLVIVTVCSVYLLLVLLAGCPNPASTTTSAQTGTLTSISGSPFPAGPASTYPVWLAVDPQGTYLYLASYSSSVGPVNAFTIGSGGALAADGSAYDVTGTSGAAFPDLEALTVDPSGTHLWVTAASPDLTGLTIGSKGSPSGEISGTPLGDLGAYGYSPLVDPTGDHLYVASWNAG